MIPHFKGVDFVSFYIEVPVMALMYVIWIVVKRPKARILGDGAEGRPDDEDATEQTPLFSHRGVKERWRLLDLVDVNTVDLYRDEHKEDTLDLAEDSEREARTAGKWGWFWRVYYLVA